MYRNIKIKFVISRWRKYRKTSIDAKLSPYWQQQYDDMFRGW